MRNQTHQGRLILMFPSDSFSFVLEAKPALRHTGAHSSPTGQGWDLKLQVKINHAECNLSKLWMAESIIQK